MSQNALKVPRNEEHKAVWPGKVHKLIPPAVHNQSYVKTWEGKGKISETQTWSPTLTLATAEIKRGFRDYFLLPGCFFSVGEPMRKVCGRVELGCRSEKQTPVLLLAFNDLLPLAAHS